MITIFNKDYQFLNLKSLNIENENSSSETLFFNEIIFQNLEFFRIVNLKLKVETENKIKFQKIIEFRIINSEIIVNNPIILIPKNLKVLEIRNCGTIINNILLDLNCFNYINHLIVEGITQKLNFSSLPLIKLSGHKNECIQKFVQKIFDKSCDKNILDYRQFFFDYKIK